MRILSRRKLSLIDQINFYSDNNQLKITIICRFISVIPSVNLDLSLVKIDISIQGDSKQEIISNIRQKINQ